MRTNGTICFKTSAGATSLNDNGEVVTSKMTFSRPISCNIAVNGDNRKGFYENGVYHQASYVILIEDSSEDVFGYDRAIIERNGKQLGEFQIASIELVQSQGRVRIVL